MILAVHLFLSINSSCLAIKILETQAVVTMCLDSIFLKYFEDLVFRDVRITVNKQKIYCNSIIKVWYGYSGILTCECKIWT